MPNMQGAPLEEQVKVLLEQNLAYSKEIYNLAKQTKRYIFWGRVMSVISLVLFVILPIILGAMYLPTLLNDFMGSFIPGGAGQAGGLEAILGGYGLDNAELMDLINDQGGPLDAYKNILDQNYQ